MIEIPNLEVMQKIFNGFDEEYNFESTVGKYKTINTELIDFAKEQGMDDPDSAACALMLADYVITSSEVPPGLSDKERRSSIIKAFSEGIKSRSDDAPLLTKIFYLSQKIGTSLRRHESFVSSRGLKKNTGLLLLKDLFVTPYLEFVENTLGEGPVGWEMGLLASAVNQTLPDKEVNLYLQLLKGNDDYSIFESSWTIMKQLEKNSLTSVNPNMVIPNIADSKILTATTVKSKPLVSLWRGGDRVPSEDLNDIKSMLDFLDNADKENPIVFVRGELVNSELNLMMARNPFVEGKPLMLLKTPADEINVSETLSMLNIRALEKNFWQELQPEVITEIVEEEVELEEIIEEKPVEPVSHETKGPEVITEKKGLFGKILNIFRKSSETTPSTTVRSAKQPTKQKKEKVKQKIKKKKDRILPYTPNFVSHAMAAVAIGDLDLFEIWDTFRETEYIIVGTLETNFIDNETNFIAESRIGNPQDLAKVLDGLDGVLEKCANLYFDGDHQIMPSEIFFMTKDDKRLLITLKGNDERIVGTIAVTYEKDITDWRDKDEEVLKRRSLHMRTNQLLSARVHTPFDTAIARIYKNAINEDNSLVKLDYAILSINN